MEDFSTLYSFFFSVAYFVEISVGKDILVYSCELAGILYIS